MMNTIGIIPARMGASRYPNKPLEKILGMPMVGHCYHRTLLALGGDATFVATCDSEIMEYINSIGGASIMTSITHTRATTRTAEALNLLELKNQKKFDIVVMVQGDEPLILPETISECLKHFEDPAVKIVNVMSRIKTYDQFVDKNNVKVVFNSNSDALYFSREPIPSPWRGIEKIPMFMQTGIIAFRRDELLRINAMNESQLEKIESIDMNRVLEAGGQIRMVPTESITFGVDTPEELKEASKLMQFDPTLLRYMKQ